MTTFTVPEIETPVTTVIAPPPPPLPAKYRFAEAVASLIPGPPAPPPPTRATSTVVKPVGGVHAASSAVMVI
jgi:hypothetical protein